MKQGYIFARYSEVRKLAEYKGDRYGKVWSTEEKDSLVHHYNLGMDLKSLCEYLGRPAVGVMSTLEKREVVYFDASKDAFIVRKPPTNPIPSTPPVSKSQEPSIPASPSNEEVPMSQASIPNPNHKPAANIETVVRIQGTDASAMSDDAIFEFIARLETQRKVMDNIVNKPKKLIAKMESLQADIAKLVEYVDGR